MNKDVIYIEPEQDITDILANIKAAKHRIIALVPPKKAGVLRSAVNFKLIAKTARQNDKTVVLITADESLRRLATSVAMPTAKTLSSKPVLPDSEEAAEFGADADEDNDVIEDEAAEEEPEEEKPAKKVPVATAVKVAKKKPEAPSEDVIEGEPEPDSSEEDKPKTKEEKNVAKMKGAKIPNIKKYRKFIIAGGIVLVLLIVFTFWANVIAPSAKITVSVHVAEQNFTEKVSFVSDESKADPKTGVLFIEQKSVTKKAEADFEATGEVDKGTKATGTVTVTLPAGSSLKGRKTLSIPKDATFTINGKVFVVTEGKSVPIDTMTPKNQNTYWVYCNETDIESRCSKSDITSGAIPVVAKDVGEESNIAAASSNIGSSVSIDGYKVTSSAMTGGTSKKVKIVSKDDVDKAVSGLGSSAESEAREELASQFSSDYILLGSMTQSEPKITTSPNVNEEVGDNVTPKVVKEVTFTMYAVQRESVKTYISEVVAAKLGDDTQEIYDTGIDKAFFESFQNSNDNNSAKLKTAVKTGPRVTKEMVAEKSLGKKTGEVKNTLGSINGVSNVKIETSYFWVWSIPNDTNKVDIEIKVE